jgi:Uma2 family endonuclease
MSVGIRINNQLEIPPGIESLDAFRRWVHSDDFPEEGRINWIRGKLEIEMAPDNIFWHSSPKSEIGAIIVHSSHIGDLGHAFIDKTRVTMPGVDLSCEPDVVFVSHESIAEGRVEFIPTVNQAPDSYLEIAGPPDMVLEVVSDSSVVKDTERLFCDYYEGGVREYWLVDARGAELSFQIFTRGVTGFRPADTDDDGYQRSAVFNTWYRFTRERGKNDLWRYDLAERI